MTAEQYRYPYLDSSVFIAWLKGEFVQGVDALNAVSHPQISCGEPRMLGQLNLDMERDGE